MIDFHRKGNNQQKCWFSVVTNSQSRWNIICKLVSVRGKSPCDCKSVYDTLRKMPSMCPVKKNMISHSHAVVPNIPNLISKSHPHYKHFESIAHIEHRKINDLFLARLRQEQASDPWINEIKHSSTVVQCAKKSNLFNRGAASWHNLSPCIHERWSHGNVVTPLARNSNI